MIKFYDLQKVNAQYADELRDAAVSIINRGQYILDYQVATFREDFAKFIGTKYAIGVGNGFDALCLIFRAYIEMGVMKEGDEVIVPANTFIATVLAIRANKLLPVFIDVDNNTYNLDFSLIERNLTTRTKAIVVVHLYGSPCWSSKLEQLANDYGLRIVEDNAQAFGAMFKNHYTGSLGDAAAHSFYPTKPLGCLGDGGMITTDDSELADIVFQLSNYGGKEKYLYNYIGVNSRLDELQAAFLNVKLKYSQKEWQVRRSIALYYWENIENDKIVLPPKDFYSAWHLFVIRTENRNGLQDYLMSHQISTLIHYPVPVHKQEAFSIYNSLSLPVTEQLSRDVLSLPLSSVMTLEEVDQVVKCINQWKG